MMLLTIAMLAVPLVRPGASAVAYGMALGASGAAARALEAGAIPRLYGLRHLGSIRGMVTALGERRRRSDRWRSRSDTTRRVAYGGVLRWLVVLPITVAVLGMFAPMPGPPDARRMNAHRFA